MAKLIIRFNTKHVGDSDVWRIFEDDREHHVAEVYISVLTYTNSCFDDHGERKWNICCEGSLTIKDGKAYIDYHGR